MDGPLRLSINAIRIGAGDCSVSETLGALVRGDFKGMPVLESDYRGASEDEVRADQNAVLEMLKGQLR